MIKTSLSDADLMTLQSYLEKGDRSAFYLAYYDLTGSSQALALAQISSFSETIGKTAYYANYMAYEVAGNVYGTLPTFQQNVDDFSLQIAKTIYNNIANDIHFNQGTGILTDGNLLMIAQGAWTTKGIPSFFPGNSLELQALATGDFTYAWNHFSDFFTPGAVVGSTGFALGFLQQNNTYSYLSPLFGAEQTVPPGGRVGQSADGRVSWTVGADGKVVYGSVHIKDLIFLPQLSAIDTGQSVQFAGTPPSGVTQTLSVGQDGSVSLAEIAPFGDIGLLQRVRASRS